MLFHVTMTHTIEDCPGYNPERSPEVAATYDKIEEISRKFNVKLHFIVEGLPEHVAFALAEADDPADLALFLAEGVPYRADFEVTAVMHVSDLVAKIKPLIGKA